jgi:hypothetical protein
MRRLPKDELYHLYVHEFYTYQDLAKHFRCSTETIRLNMELYNIPRLKKGNQLARKMKMTEGELRQLLNDLYWKDKMTIIEIAEFLETNQFTIWSNLKRLGIKRRHARKR